MDRKKKRKQISAALAMLLAVSLAANVGSAVQAGDGEGVIIEENGAGQTEKEVEASETVLETAAEPEEVTEKPSEIAAGPEAVTEKPSETAAEPEVVTEQPSETVAEQETEVQTEAPIKAETEVQTETLAEPETEAENIGTESGTESPAGEQTESAESETGEQTESAESETEEKKNAESETEEKIDTAESATWEQTELTESETGGQMDIAESENGERVEHTESEIEEQTEPAESATEEQVEVTETETEKQTEPTETETGEQTENAETETEEPTEAPETETATLTETAQAQTAEDNLSDEEEETSVAIEWGSFHFVYQEYSSWEPETHTLHTYGKWITEDGEDYAEITLINNGTSAVEIECSFRNEAASSELETVSGSFLSGKTEEKLRLEVGERKSIAFRMDGKLSGTISEESVLGMMQVIVRNAEGGNTIE